MTWHSAQSFAYSAAMALALALAVLFLTDAAAESPPMSLWTNYTNVNDVMGMVARSDTLWLATRGGLVKLVVEATMRESRFTNAEGLGGNDLRFVALDSQQSVWTGGVNGRLSHRRGESGWDVFRFEDGDGHAVPLNAAAPGPGGILWVASDIGVHKFDINRHGGEIRETYTRIGSWPDNSPVYDVLVSAGDVWLVGRAGIARGRADDQFLMDRAHWRTWSDFDSLTTIVAWRGQVYAGGKGGMYTWEGPSPGANDSIWVGGTMTDRTVRRLHPEHDTLWAVTSVGLSHCTAGGCQDVALPPYPPSAPTSVASTADGSLWVGQLARGLLYLLREEWFAYVFAGPLDNSFSRLALGADGKVWCVHASSGADFLQNGTFSVLRYFDAGPSNPGTSVAVGPDGNVWLGDWGGGAYWVNGSAPLADSGVGWVRFDSSNSSLIWHQNPLHTPNNYVVVNGISIDPRGRVWFANAFADSGRALAYYDHGCWGAFDSSSGFASTRPAALLARDGSVLVGFEDRGLAELDYREPLCSGGRPVPQRGRLVSKGTADGLPSDVVRAILIDRADSLWIGTNLGLVRYAADRRRFFPVSLPPEAGLTINALVVDAANTIWVGTSLGLVSVAPDQTMQFFNSDNSGLAGEPVSDVAVEARSGAVWIATSAGLSRLTGAVAPDSSAADVIAYPNPFVIVSDADALVRFNAPYGSRAFIFTAAGHPVIDLDATRGWDGRNADGRYVVTGVYLFVIRGPRGDYGRGKIALLNRR